MPRPPRIKPQDLTQTPEERAQNLNDLRAEQIQSLMGSIAHHIGSAQLMLDRLYINKGDQQRVHDILTEAHDLVREAEARFSAVPLDPAGVRRDYETDPNLDPSASR